MEAPTAVGTRMSQLEDLLKQSMSHTHDALGVLEGWRRHFFEVDTLISDVAKRSAQISNLRTSFSQARDRIDEIQDNLDTAKQVLARCNGAPLVTLHAGRASNTGRPRRRLCRVSARI